MTAAPAAAPAAAPLVMRSRLGELEGCWLRVACACGRSCAFPCKLLAGQHGAGVHLGAILSRLKCKGCGRPPDEAQLTERGDTGARGGAGGWAVPLMRWPGRAAIGAEPATG